MDAPRAAVRLSAVAAVGMLTALVLASVLQTGVAQGSPIKSRDGSAFTLPREAGVYDAQWRDDPILVVVTTRAHLAAVEEVRGDGTATQAVPVGDGLVAFAASARSNRNGCTGTFRPELGASKDVGDYDGDGLPDGRFVDLCHHGQWDLFHRGAAIPVTPTCGPLAMLRLDVDGGRLWSTGFDGPVHGQWCDQWARP